MFYSSTIFAFKSLLGSILGKRETCDKHPDYVPSLFLVKDKKGQSPHRSYRKLERNKRRLKRLKPKVSFRYFWKFDRETALDSRKPDVTKKKIYLKN